MHARRIFGDHSSQKIETVQMGRRAGVGYRSRRDQPVRDDAGRGMQRMKPASPPFAAPVRIGAEVEEYLHHRQIAGAGHDSRRIEREHGSVDLLTKLRMTLEESAHRARIATRESVVHVLQC